jgi:hypothetical protein
VRTTEISLCDENDLAGRLTDMRTWLDMHRYEPSTFTYFFLDPGLRIRVTFNIDGEAEAFAQRFGGFLLDNKDNRSARDGLVASLGREQGPYRAATS